MLNLALSGIESTLTGLQVSGIDLIEKYGKLVIPLPIQESIAETAKGEQIMKERVFPVSANTNFDTCITTRSYQHLIPNTHYRSLAYFEQTGKMQINQQESKKYPKGNTLVYEAPVNFVFWTNTNKLQITGATNFSVAAPVSFIILDALCQKQGFDLNNPNYPNANVKMIFTGQEVKDSKKIFGKYSCYNSDSLTRFLLAPYDFFALCFTVRFRINKKCLQNIIIDKDKDCDTDLV